MFLVSPIWLVLLAPWAGLVIWLLRGRFETRGVPFLELWGREIAQTRRPDRSWKIPPPAVAALLAGMLLAIVAATGPMIEIRRIAGAIPPLPPDVRIEFLAVRNVPTTQAMIRLCNQSDLTTAKLTVRAGGAVVSAKVDLPGRGQMRNYFVDWPVSGSTIEAEVSGGADNKIFHQLQATGRTIWPMVAARGALPPEVNRMIEVYSRRRPPGAGSKHIAVATASENFVADEPTAILMSPRSGTGGLSAKKLIVGDGPLTRSINWAGALAGAQVESPPSGDWQAVVSAAGRIIVASREKPFKQVWVGFRSDNFPHRADFVVFWSNVFMWLGDVEGSYEASAQSEPAAMPPSAPATRNGLPMAGQVFLSALALMVVSALAWKAPKVGHYKEFKS
jgi:hypothetical protein